MIPVPSLRDVARWLLTVIALTVVASVIWHGGASRQGALSSDTVASRDWCFAVADTILAHAEEAANATLSANAVLTSYLTGRALPTEQPTRQADEP